MNQRLKQSAKTSQIESLAERIFIQMCVTTHQGFDESHYVRRAYKLAKAFYQTVGDEKTSSNVKEATMKK
ncbi:MAG: hypothetical protein K0U86_11785 [Planctomycetes bacterium]|nr:hypothetical protein [Planctomycetota bacterium]MCH9725564.1 hypothetical protein [Planctomycetota bacterium]MCH9777618.1 hypothetical protein [Planctomycetota bacterium]MCH9790813.1 hypothetical protein [Planctomycetota bacterium]